MKYIKLFENNDEMIQTLKDICLDLEDEGFVIVYNKTDGFNTSHSMDRRSYEMVKNIKYRMINYISKLNERCFSSSEVKDTIDRIENYLGDKFYYVITNNGSKWRDFKSVSVGIDQVIILYKD